MTEAPPIATLFPQAYALFQQGNLAGSETLLSRILAAAPQDAQALHLMGVLQLRQGRNEQGAQFLARAAEAQPRQAALRRNLGKSLMLLGRPDEAVEHLSAALALQPDLLEVWFELGNALDEAKRLDEAETAYRKLLALQPTHVPVKLALAAVLIEMGRPGEAEPLLRQGLSETTDKRMAADLHHNLSLAARRQQHLEEALEHLEQEQALAPSRNELDLNRVDILEELHCFDEAKVAYETMLARAPTDERFHHGYNELLYRLGDDANFLGSYQRAPKTLPLLLARGTFLAHAGRNDEAGAVFQESLTLFPGNKEGLLGVGVALSNAGRFAEAVTAYEIAARHFPEDGAICRNMATALAQLGDAEKSGAMAARALAIDPTDQLALALRGTAWRMLSDERHEWLNGYDEFIRIFDLEPPEGFSGMAAFNAELCAALESLHPPVREYLRQSLRGGTQTPGNLFGGGHALVEKLRQRLAEAVRRYIAELRSDPAHPFLSRRAADFAFSDSWSSRLRDKGFHVDHIHSQGWISSCYYVDVPDVVKDQSQRQGWIKFGVPNFEVTPALPIRRAIQPLPGRLVLFPSYLWHGTIPFHDARARTTIAFDVVPAG
jgi:tetratricopeptide (TPR) repeat protein